jgi:hypothetical protein
MYISESRPSVKWMSEPYPSVKCMSKPYPSASCTSESYSRVMHTRVMSFCYLLVRIMSDCNKHVALFSFCFMHIAHVTVLACQNHVLQLRDWWSYSKSFWYMLDWVKSSYYICIIPSHALVCPKAVLRILFPVSHPYVGRFAQDD